MVKGITKEPAVKAGKLIEINEGQIQAHLGEMVRQSVEGALNAMLDAEADQLCGAERYERSPEKGSAK